MVQTAMASTEKEKSLHANTAFHCTKLEKELATIKKEAAEGEKRRRSLLNDRENMKKECNALRNNNAALSRKLETMDKKLEITMNAHNLWRMSSRATRR